MILATMVLPDKVESNKTALYWNGRYRTEEHQIEPETSVSFDTYFNAFFYGPYKKYTTVQKIRFNVVTSGRAKIELMLSDCSGKEQLIEQRVVNGRYVTTNFLPCELARLPGDGMLFLKVSSEGGYVRFHSGLVETTDSESQRVHLAAVICTYKREAYVKHNLAVLQQKILENAACPVKKNLDVLVVDNGHTLELQDTEQIHVFPNKNYGGSGGFTRGLIEAYRRKGQYTHVLFMDDDISFEPESLLRTIRFLKVLKPSEIPIFIGGQMLAEGAPTIQFESGACFVKGHVIGNNRGLDVSKRENLLLNMCQKKTEYNAWWYCCFPISVVERYGLPFPFFIKGDDVEYGLRIQPQIVLTNGIGVWHMAFQDKYSPHLEYYIKRNELIVSTLRDPAMSAYAAIWKLLKACGKAILVGDTRNIQFLLMAYQDFLKGPQFLYATDEEQLNSSLLMLREKPAPCRLCALLTASIKLPPVFVQIICRYKELRQMYQTDGIALTTLDFWETHLNIGE